MSQKAVNAAVKTALQNKDKPLAIILAGHNGSGKSTLWYQYAVDELKIPLINADRLMMSILPEPDSKRRLVPWAQQLRDTDELWMGVAQRGVQAFVAQAIGAKASFAMETVFSDWEPQADGTIRSKIDLIKNLQNAGYFVLLMFVGLADVNLSVGRVLSRKSEGGHDVAYKKLHKRFPRTQHAVNAALNVADAAILFDNSRSEVLAFTPVQIRQKKKVMYDIRLDMKRVSKRITAWLDIVAPAA